MGIFFGHHADPWLRNGPDENVGYNYLEVEINDIISLQACM